MKGFDVKNVKADFFTRPITTANHPDAKENPALRSTIGVAPAFIREVGGNVVLLSIVTGEGNGAIAMLDRHSIIPVMLMMQKIAIESGVMPVPGGIEPAPEELIN